MADYVVTTDFSVKDGLTTGDPNKLIKGSDFDTEFDNIATAVGTKYDSNDVASQAQAEAEASNTVLITPLRLANWSNYNAGVVGDLQAYTDPNVDTIFGWDDSASAAIGFTLGDGISSSGTSIVGDINGLTTQTGLDSANDYLALYDASAGGLKKVSIADLVISGGGSVPSSRLITSGTGMTGGGDLSADRTLNVVGGNGITANADDIALTDAAASTTNPIDISSGTVSFDGSTLTNIEGSALAATDTIVVMDGTVPKGMHIQDIGMRVQTGQTTQTLAASDMNSIMEFTGTATLTLPLNSTTDLPIGVPVVLNMKHATQELTVTAAASVTLVSIYHPAGTAAASDTVLAGGTAVLYKTATNVWALAGDIST